MKSEPTVFVVDDDPAIRQSMSALVDSVGLACETFASAQDFLSAYDPARPGCLVLDIRMPDMSGLELQNKLSTAGIRIPVIFISGYTDVSMAVQAMENGAVTVIEKPFGGQAMLERIQQAIQLNLSALREQADHEEITSRLARLTPRQRKVMELMMGGKSNEEIAAQLKVTTNTVNRHRAHVMETMHAQSLTGLVKLVLARIEEN